MRSRHAAHVPADLHTERVVPDEYLVLGDINLLQLAIRVKRYDIVEMVAKASDGWVVRRMTSKSVRENDIQALRCLYDAGADFTRGGILSNAYTVDCVKACLDYGADVNSIWKNGINALSRAFLLGKADMADLLLARGARPTELAVNTFAKHTLQFPRRAEIAWTLATLGADLSPLPAKLVRKVYRRAFLRGPWRRKDGTAMPVDLMLYIARLI